MVDKAEVLASLRDRLTANLERVSGAQEAVQSGATHSEAKQEHPKDTRSTEASYLSRGLAERVEAMQEEVRILNVFRLRRREEDDPIGLGDLVALVGEDENEAIHFLAPVGGGEKLVVHGVDVVVLTPRAALGGALVGKYAGDEIDLVVPRGKRTVEIRWVR